MTIMASFPAVSDRRGRNRLVRSCSVTAAVAGLALFAAGCGGSSGPGVAGVASTTDSTTTAASSGGSPSSSGTLAKQEAYAKCMRSHGITDFPDPTPDSSGGGGFDINGSPGSDLNPNLPRYQAADTACKPLLPSGGVSRPVGAVQEQAWLKWAACIRSHGIPTFPDPSFAGGGVKLASGSGVKPNSPQFAAAQKACTRLYPSSTK
jgi:hypothetical protein